MKDDEKRIMVYGDGKKSMTYEEVCDELGFYSSIHFIKITTRGTITFTLGKPDEIKALYEAVENSKFKMAQSLASCKVGGYWDL